MELFILVGTPFVLAAAILFASIRLRAEVQGWLLAAVMLLLFAVFLARLPAIQEQGAVSYALPWMPQIGLELVVYLDGLALLFALVVTGVGAAIMAYAGFYFDDARQVGRFFALLLTFTGSMLALVLAGNLLTLFVAWELTSIVSFLLISFKGSDIEARQGASQALIVTGGGGLALLAGLLLIGNAAGTMDIGTILSSGELLRQHPWYAAFTLLILLGSFSKSAQFPLHFWLPGAMAAPTPASAFLHSATMVKAGIYLLARFYPVLANTPLWNNALVLVGLTTMLVGIVLALRQRDLKGILAFSTISQLGALVALIGLPESLGLKAAMLGILAHALYKATLFLVAGAVDHATGTRNIEELGGLRRHLPGFALITAVAGLSMAGVPPLLGFVSKETLLEAVIEQPAALLVVVISAALTVTVALRLFWDVFISKRRVALPQPKHGEHDRHHPYGDDASDYSHLHILPTGMAAGPGALVLVSVVLGVGVGVLASPLVSAAVGESVSLYLFPPYVNLALVLSTTALVLGTLLFMARRWWLAWHVPTLPGGAEVYRAGIRLIEAAGDTLLLTQNGRIRYYLAAILFSLVALLSTAIINIDLRLIEPPIFLNSAADVLKAALLALALVATLASILFKRHLLAALSLGVAGYSVGGLFLLEPAPDVALVQFLVETLATVLIVIILARTSEAERSRAIANLWGQTRPGLARDILISLAMGAAVGLFALIAVSSRPTPNPIAAWHLQNALPLVRVNDVVAAVVTDFRGTDTLIEITVFGMAALGVLTLLARPKPGGVWRLGRWGILNRNRGVLINPVQDDPAPVEEIVYSSRFTDPVTQLAAVLVLPFAFLIAMAHILYAGVSPGDGFTAGVILGLGVTLWFVVYGYEETKTRLRWLHPPPMIGIGLLIAFANAALPVLFGREFLGFTALDGVSIADIKLASPVLFEIGICLTVFGGISAIIEAISHPKEVEPL